LAHRAKARAFFRAAGGDPDRSGPLAAWAHAAHANPDTRRRVLVANGTLVGEARHYPSRLGAAYVTSVADERNADLAVGALGRRHGQPVIIATYSNVCVGQAPGERA
jgi:hypothetical protein